MQRGALRDTANLSICERALLHETSQNAFSALFGMMVSTCIDLQATVGIAMGGGVDAAAEVAGIVLLGDRCVCGLSVDWASAWN